MIYPSSLVKYCATATLLHWTWCLNIIKISLVYTMKHDSIQNQFFSSYSLLIAICCKWFIEFLIQSRLNFVWKYWNHSKSTWNRNNSGSFQYGLIQCDFIKCDKTRWTSTFLNIHFKWNFIVIYHFKMFNFWSFQQNVIGFYWISSVPDTRI